MFQKSDGTMGTTDIPCIRVVFGCMVSTFNKIYLHLYDIKAIARDSLREKLFFSFFFFTNYEETFRHIN